MKPEVAADEHDANHHAGAGGEVVGELSMVSSKPTPASIFGRLTA
ncbi:MAG: hypothetical protein ACLUO4_09585 [Christensenellales bacterium]